MEASGQAGEACRWRAAWERAGWLVRISPWHPLRGERQPAAHQQPLYPRLVGYALSATGSSLARWLFSVDRSSSPLMASPPCRTSAVAGQRSGRVQYFKGICAPAAAPRPLACEGAPPLPASRERSFSLRPAALRTMRPGYGWLDGASADGPGVMMKHAGPRHHNFNPTRARPQKPPFPAGGRQSGK